ncbi:MAG: extensin family protein [Pseudomonadota bacterium]
MIRLAVVVILLATAATAAPDRSLRPPERAGTPILEASGAITPARQNSAALAAADRGQGLAESLRPELRPRKFRRIARNRQRMRERGAVCGDWEIQGEPVGNVPGKWRGCGVADAVRVNTVAGVTLSQSAIMDCRTATALRTWVEDTAKPTLAKTGGGLKSLRVAAHYICRTRNNKPGGRISEHGKGRAIDISGVQLHSGQVISVLHGWQAKDTSQFMRTLHKGACGPFGTVLGPNSDRFHRDHFHFDTAWYRTGPYCR